MSLTSFISSNCNRHGPRFLCAFTVLVTGAVRRLPYVLAGEISYLFSVDAYPIVVAVLCTSILTFYGPTKKSLTAAVLLPIFLWWIWGLPYLSFPTVHARPRTPGFSSFTVAISSFSRRTAPSCGRVIFSLLSQVVAEILPPVVVVLVAQRRYSDEAVTVRVSERNLPSVVFVSVRRQRPEETQDERFGHEGTGSGFVWDKKGNIVTNFHVIGGEYNRVYVKFSDRDFFYEAEVVGRDKKSDIAVLRVAEQAKNMKPVHVGQSTKLRMGQKVYAIGNPFGLDHSLTTGVVSGLGRDLKTPTGGVIYDGIQTDASINPGSSGGPLLDSSGKLIGVNTAFYSPNGASSGIGFAIAIDTVHGIIEQIIAGRAATRPYIGIKFVPDQSQQQFGLGGLLVYHVDPNSPAEKAGIRANRIEDDGQEKKGDVIISFNGEIVNNGSDLYNILDKCEVGNEVMVQVLRDGETEDLFVRLEKR